MKNLISVVITTKNEEQVLGDLLVSLKSQTHRDFETIVVDNQSQDLTKEIAREFGARVFDQGPERSAQRNFGVKKARGNYVLISDADMVLTKNVLKECFEKLNKNQKWGALVIPEKSFGIGFWARCRAFEREFYLGEESIEAARCFRRDLFLQFGGYDETMTGPEDYDLPLRMKKAGIKIGRIRNYILHNEKRFSPIGSAKKKFYYASHARTFLKRHPEMVISQGNLLLRPVFFRKWKKLVSHPEVALGMFFIKALEMTGALAGIIYSGIIRRQ